MFDPSLLLPFALACFVIVIVPGPSVTVIIAKVVGGLLPLGAKALKLDPAVMASPFISTIVDALSLLVYFLFAKAILKL